jgi:hypothetical protein
MHIALWLLLSLTSYNVIGPGICDIDSGLQKQIEQIQISNTKQKKEIKSLLHEQNIITKNCWRKFLNLMIDFSRISYLDHNRCSSLPSEA